MTAFPKPSRMKNVKYLKWVRLQPCLVDYVEAQAHHTVTVGAGGSDYRIVPLCHVHHQELHQIGCKTFETKHRLDLQQEIIRLLETYISEGKNAK